MKLAVALSVVPLLATAKVLIAVTPPFHTIGDTYDVEWLVDTKMSLELLLVKKNDNGWEPVKTLFEGVESTPCNGSWTWYIDDSYSIGGDYGLWLNGQNIPDDDTGYASLTDWFEIKTGPSLSSQD